MKSIKITDVENSVSFTFENDRALGGLINQVEGFEYPQAIPVVQDVARNGAIGVTTKFGRRNCSFVTRFTCDVLDTRQEMLAALRQTGELKLIQFTTLDDLTLEFYAYVKRVLAPYTSMKKPVLIELEAPDWRFLSQTSFEFETAQTVLSGGGTIPGAMPWAIPIPVGAPSVIDNIGTDEADPVFTIDGPGTLFTVGNQTTGEEFIINQSLSAGETIEVDVANRTVLLNGTTSIYSSLSGDFWTLQPGMNVIRFLASGRDTPTLLTIAYQYAYLGV